MTAESSEVTCFCCGVCCSKYQVQMPLAEAQGIAEKLGLIWEQFQSDYLDPAWPGVRTVLARHDAVGCIFLETQPGGKVFFCRIQPFKPASCIEWQADLSKADCRSGLTQHWRLEVDAENRLMGAPEDLTAFNALLADLEGESTQTGRD